MESKIIVLHPHFAKFSGSSIFTLEISHEFQKKGYEVSIISIRTNPKVVTSKYSKITFINIGGFLSSSIFFWLLLPLSSLKVILEISRIKNAVILTHVFPANWWAGIYKALGGKKKVLWMCQEPSAFIHSTEWIASVESKLMRTLILIFRSILKLMDIYLVRKSDSIFSSSDYTASEVSKIYGVDKASIIPVYGGIDKDIFRNDETIKREQQIICVNSLYKFKNTETVVDAFKLFLQKSPFKDYKLLIIGDGPERAFLQKQAKGLGIEHKVSFLANISIDKLSNHYQESKCLVLASNAEPLGLVVLEAMSCGTPCIVSKNGGAKELIRDSLTGFETEIDAQSIADNLEKLLQSETYFKSVSRNCVKRSKEFSWDKTSDLILKHLFT